MKLLFPLPRSAVLHKIYFLHLDGLRGSGLKEHISPKNKQLSVKLKGSSADRLRLATDSSALAHFWVSGFRFKFFAMQYEDV